LVACQAHGGEPKTQVRRVCTDTSPAFIKGVTEHLGDPNCGRRRGARGDPILVGVLERCELQREAVHLHVVDDNGPNAYATGRRSIALTVRAA